MIGLKELIDMKDEFEHEKIFVEAKISVVKNLIEKEIEKEKETEETEVTELETVV
jgi:hypothetical protein